MGWVVVVAVAAAAAVVVVVVVEKRYITLVQKYWLAKLVQAMCGPCNEM